LWTGGGPSYRTDLARALLPAAVQSKIDKRYAKPASAKFWMLAYSVDTLLSKDDPDIVESRRLLETSTHPFDDVWFLYPYAEKDLGALVHVWPARRDVCWLLIPSTAVYEVFRAIFARSGDVTGCETARR
jgi:hypothetical protein